MHSKYCFVWEICRIVVKDTSVCECVDAVSIETQFCAYVYENFSSPHCYQLRVSNSQESPLKSSKQILIPANMIFNYDDNQIPDLSRKNSLEFLFFVFRCQHKPFYLSESKVLQYFGSMRHNSGAPDAFYQGHKGDKLHWTPNLSDTL